MAVFVFVDAAGAAGGGGDGEAAAATAAAAAPGVGGPRGDDDREEIRTDFSMGSSSHFLRSYPFLNASAFSLERNRS